MFVYAWGGFKFRTF